MQRVQVKTTKCVDKNEYYQVNLRLTGYKNGSYQRVKRKVSDYDLLFVLTNEGKCYLILADRIGGSSGICLTKKYDEFLINGDCNR